MAIFGNNTAYVAARAKSRKSNLMDRTRLRQLIQQTPDQLTVAVADNGYRAEIDLYACLLYTSPSPRDVEESRMPSSA